MKSKDKEILFTVGPVEMPPLIRRMGAHPLPYFRTDEFSEANLESAALLKEMVRASPDAQVAFLTASGSGAMEAAVINTFGKEDRLLVVAGGTFGRRFGEICRACDLPHTTIDLKQGKLLRTRDLEPYLGQGYTGLLLNAHETSTGVLHDLPVVGAFCRQAGWTLVVDAISSFLADPYSMKDWNIDVTILSTQKGLALPPGLSMLVVENRTAERMRTRNVPSLYFNLVRYFDNMTRGQTPFTPAVGVLLQLRTRLQQIQRQGVDRIIEQTAGLARDFRHRAAGLPFAIPSERLSNALTPLQPLPHVSAHEIFLQLKKRYNIFVCPNGGELRDRLFRVGHMGYLTTDDNTRLLKALSDLHEEGAL
jgi:aspartate aminotransferase-like enzyme